MNSRKVFLNCFLFLIFAFLPACSNTAIKQESKEITKDKPAKEEAHKPDKPGNEKEEEKLPVLNVGDSLKDIIQSTKVKTVKGKEKSLKDFMGSEKTLIAVVKPGCVYCESMLAIKSATGVKTKAKFLVILDASHADFKTFKEKYKKFKSAGGEWLFDINSDMHSKFGVNSFPRFLVIDKAGNLEQMQIGLFLPEDQKELEGKSFPEILQMLSEQTMSWMSGL